MMSLFKMRKWAKSVELRLLLLESLPNHQNHLLRLQEDHVTKCGDWPSIIGQVRNAIVHACSKIQRGETTFGKISWALRCKGSGSHLFLDICVCIDLLLGLFTYMYRCLPLLREWVVKSRASPVQPWSKSCVPLQSGPRKLWSDENLQRAVVAVEKEGESLCTLLLFYFCKSNGTRQTFA